MSRDRRVLQVMGSLNVGGAETMIVSATRELVRMGFDVDFLVFGKEVGALESEVEGLGCRIIRMDSPAASGRVRFVRDLAGLLRKEGPFEVIHSHVNRASGLVLAAAARVKVPVRIAHSHMTHDYSRGLKRRVYKICSSHLISSRATTLVACGEEAGRHLFGGAWGKRGVVVHNGTDVETFLAARGAGADFRAELRVAPDAILVGAIGRLVPVKNHRFLLDVLAQDRERKLHLVIVGEGDLHDELEDMARREGLDNYVSLVGLRRDIPDILAALDFLVMPSLHEGLPMTLVETQAAGTPAVVSSTVASEVDLGLGLLRFLPIDNPAAWFQELIGPIPADVVDADIRFCFDRAGYDCAKAAEKLASLYQVS